MTSNWSPQQPSPAQMKEFFALIVEGRITRGSMEGFLRSSTQPISVEEAKGIMGEKNFFGPDEWRKLFGEKFQLVSVPEIPWGRAELEDPGINQEHFLFLGSERLGGEPLNLPMWCSLFSGKKHPKFYQACLKHEFAQKVCGARWYLMPVGIIEGSTCLIYKRQVSKLPKWYEVPSMIERISANILYFLVNSESEYLDAYHKARTRDLSDDGARVVVRGFSKEGLDVERWGDGAHFSIGIAASRKFWD